MYAKPKTYGTHKNFVPEFIIFFFSFALISLSRCNANQTQNMRTGFGHIRFNQYAFNTQWFQFDTGIDSHLPLCLALFGPPSWPFFHQIVINAYGCYSNFHSGSLRFGHSTKVFNGFFLLPTNAKAKEKQ